MEKIAILFNPSSRRGKSGKAKERIERILNNNSINYDLFVSESEAHFKQLTLETAPKYQTIVGVGGDTTFNIMVRKLLRANYQPPAIGMIGTGSANDIVRSLGILKIKEACAAIKKGSTTTMDVGCIKIDRKSKPYYFLGSLSIGLSTAVNRYVAKFQQNHKVIARVQPFYQLFPGLFGIHDFFAKNKPPLQVKIKYSNNGKAIIKDLDFSLLVILNTPYYANGLKLGIEDGSSDGILDCCAIDTRNFWDTFVMALKIQRGTHTQCQNVEYVQSPSFKAYSQYPLDILADGEIIEEVKEFEVSIIKDKLKVLSV
jgi:diacylglycerol kinase family enzyme